MERVVLCARCHKEIVGRPAISRKNPNDKVCSKCGVEEALESVPNNVMSNETKQDILAFATTSIEQHWG